MGLFAYNEGMEEILICILQYYCLVEKVSA